MFGTELSSNPSSPNQQLPRGISDIMGSWVCGLGELIKNSNDDLKMSPYCWQEPQIYQWLLKVCDKNSKLEGLQIANLQPFIANFHSGAFGHLDPELRDIIALEHRKLFDDWQGLQLDASSDSEYSNGMSPAPSTTGVLTGSTDDLTGPTTGPSGCVRLPCMGGGIDESVYPHSASPDSGSERISGNGSPSGYIEQPPSDLYCADSLSPGHHIPHPPHTAELWNPVQTTSTQGLIASMPTHGPAQMVWPHTDPSLFPASHAHPMQNYPSVLQMAPDFQPPCIPQFPQFCLSSPTPGHIPFPETLLPPHSHHLPSHLAGGMEPPKPPKRSKKAHKKKGQGRNQTDKVVDTRILESMPSSVQLWEFVLRVLKNPLYNNILSWENQHEGIFHIHDPQALAELWGKHRNHEGMNYDKMSRAMRYYYRRGILEPVRERLTYKFALRLRPMFFD